MVQRRCAGCWQVKDRKDLIKITADYAKLRVIVNPDNLTFGRSVYLCYNDSCIEAAFKKNKLCKILKTPIPKELKGQLLNELRNS
jgi:hypothetical protein